MPTAADLSLIKLVNGYRNGPNGCMNWVKHILPNGYGMLTIGSRTDGSRKHLLAHRVSAALWKGLDINSKTCVLHKCDNKRCINPDHLFLGTPMDNAKDCVRKGRSLKGQENTNAYLSDDQIKEIRVLYSQGMTQKEIAKKCHVVQTTISRIVLRKSWPHVS